MKKYLKLMRVRHYIKNLLIFMALGCSGQLLQPRKLAVCALGFGVFCMISSAVYIINDLQDVEKDRVHPTKCRRPVASGAVSVRQARLLCAGILAAAAVFGVLTGQPGALWLPALYLAINLAYSLGLKNIPIADIGILSAGFLIRVVYGAVIADITVSNWLYLTVITVSCYLALGKRRNELRQLTDGSTRQVLKTYTPEFLDKSMGMCLTMSNVFYALWSMDANTRSLYGGANMVFSVPVVLLITLKYSMVVEGDSDGDPVEVLYHDRALMVLCLLYLLVMLAILYF